MADVLIVIRGLSDAAVAHIDASAAAKGLSRQEYLRRWFETEQSERQPQGTLTIEDMRRAATAAADQGLRLNRPRFQDSLSCNSAATRSARIGITRWHNGAPSEHGRSLGL